MIAREDIMKRRTKRRKVAKRDGMARVGEGEIGRGTGARVCRGATGMAGIIGGGVGRGRGGGKGERVMRGGGGVGRRGKGRGMSTDVYLHGQVCSLDDKSKSLVWCGVRRNIWQKYTPYRRQEIAH